MPYQTADSDTTVVVIILLVTLLVYVMMLVPTPAVLRFDDRTKNALSSKSWSEILSILFPIDRITNELKSGRSATRKALAVLMEPPSAPAVRSALSPPMKQRRAWRLGLAILVPLLGLLSIVEFDIWSSLHRGWNIDRPRVDFLTVDGRGQVWAFTGGSIVLYPEHGEPVQMSLPDLSYSSDEPITDQISSQAIDQQGQVWVGTLTRRIGIRDVNGQWTMYYPEDFGEPYDGIAILFDGQGQAWTNGPKLAKIKINIEKKIYRLESAGPTYVEAIATDEKGQLWVLDNGELKVLTSDGNWRISARVRIDDSMAGYYQSFDSTRLMIDQQGRVWIVSDNGFIQLLSRDGVWRSYTPDDLSPDPAIRTTNIVVDEQGKMWGVSGVFGLYRFDPATGWVAYNPRNSGLSDNFATSFARDNQGRIWIQTEHALHIFDPNAALPMQYVPVFSALGLILLPTALLSLVLVMIWIITFMRPGTTRSKSLRELVKFALVSFTAALCGIYSLMQQRILSERIMIALFGDGWAFNDFLIFAVAQPLYYCLIPLSALVGALIGIFILRFLVRIFRITE